MNAFKFSSVISGIILVWTSYKSYEYFGGNFMKAIEVIWPLLALITVLLLIFLPSVMYLYKSTFNRGLRAAHADAENAHTELHKTKIACSESVHEIQKETKERIAGAHEKERIAAIKELDDKWAAYHHKNNELLQREREISSREQTVRQAVNEANGYITAIKEENNQLKRATQNATNAYQRKKRQLERK